METTQYTDTLATKNPPNQPTHTSMVIEPGQLRVIKRDGRVTGYEKSRINAAIKFAFLAV